MDFGPAAFSKARAIQALFVMRLHSRLGVKRLFDT